MKFLLAALSAAFATASPLPIYGKPKNLHMKKAADIKADSKLGNKLMANARRLEGDDEVDYTWVANYSIKFQGCHHISQWNEEADGEEEVKIQTKRLVRFRLCPTEYCTAEDAGGCDSGYGDYVIDMNLYLEAYFQAVEQYWEDYCEKLEDEDYGECGQSCANANDDEKCLWDCFVEKGVEEHCADDNPYEDDEQDVQFELEEYMECGNWEPQNDNRRKLDQNEVEYFLGPYCAEQGGEIHLGLFTDETCTTFADDYGGTELYTQLTNEELPYSDENLINMDCISCMEPQEDNNDGNDNDDEDEVIEMCEEMYEQAGKCEPLLEGVVQYPNENGCTYMEGIKILRIDGTVDESKARNANKTASIFIGIFVAAFVLLAAYVYYLKTKLDRASINLAE